jgi:hypothetical protein
MSSPSTSPVAIVRSVLANEYTSPCGSTGPRCEAGESGADLYDVARNGARNGLPSSCVPCALRAAWAAACAPPPSARARPRLRRRASARSPARGRAPVASATPRTAGLPLRERRGPAATLGSLAARPARHCARQARKSSRLGGFYRSPGRWGGIADRSTRCCAAVQAARCTIEAARTRGGTEQRAAARTPIARMGQMAEPVARPLELPLRAYRRSHRRRRLYPRLSHARSRVSAAP